MQHLSPNSESTSSDINIKELLFDYLQYWKWFLLGVIISFLFAFVYLRFYVTEYGVNSTILIKDEKKGDYDELSAFSDLSIFSGKNNVENEVAILKSRTLSQNVVKELDFDISYLVEGRVVFRELYKNSPITILFIDKDKDYYKKDTIMVVSGIRNNNFILSDKKKKNSKRFDC